MEERQAMKAHFARGEQIHGKLEARQKLKAREREKEREREREWPTEERKEGKT